MLRLELAQKSNTEVTYNYFPEQEKEYGTITISIITGDVVGYETASNDKHRRYLHHAIARIEKYVGSNDYREKDVVGWY